MNFVRIVDGIVVEIIDGENIADRFHPDFVASLIADSEGSAIMGGTYSNGTFGPVPVPVLTEQRFDSERAARTAIAAGKIAVLQDLADVGEATGDDEAALIAWKRYRIALSRLVYCEDVQWPDAP